MTTTPERENKWWKTKALYAIMRVEKRTRDGLKNIQHIKYINTDNRKNTRAGDKWINGNSSESCIDTHPNCAGIGTKLHIEEHTTFTHTYRTTRKCIESFDSKLPTTIAVKMLVIACAYTALSDGIDSNGSSAIFSHCFFVSLSFVRNLPAMTHCSHYDFHRPLHVCIVFMQ